MRLANPPLIRSAVALALTIGLAACSKAPTKPTDAQQSQADEVAAHFGGAMAEDNGGAMAAFDAMAASGGAQGAPGAPGMRGARAFRASAAAAETTFSVGGVDWTLNRRYFDSLGVEHPTLSPLVTRMTVDARATGTIDNPPAFQATLAHSGSHVVDGLESAQDTLRFGGSTRDTVQSQFQIGARTAYAYSVGRRTYGGVRLLKDRSTNPWPLSGTANDTIAVDRLRTNDRNDVISHLDATVVIVFNGTQFADLTVNGTFRYRLDLRTGATNRL
jgi:hypothetical protein